MKKLERDAAKEEKLRQKKGKRDQHDEWREEEDNKQETAPTKRNKHKR